MLARDAVARAHKDAWGRIVASLARRFRDLDLAEECAQEAFELALTRWDESGVPDEPRAWLISVARQRAIDRMRRRSLEEARAAEIAYVESLREPASAAGAIEDDRLRLMFACSHPVLPLEGQMALTLRALSGLTTDEIARAFLVPSTTMQQRLVRAKARLSEARVPFEIPEPSELEERLPAVLGVVYLIFNEGYAASGGEQLVRVDLCEEAIALGRVLAHLRPDDGVVLGLLSLMRSTHARRAARIDAHGDLVSLDEQDRSRWDRAAIDEGKALALRALRMPPPNRYAIEAAIAAIHGEATSERDTDWAQIRELYVLLARLAPSPVVSLNGAVAHALAGDVAGGLARIEQLRDALDAYGPFHAARADLLRRLGRSSEASEAYSRAITLAGSAPERRWLERRRSSSTG